MNRYLINICDESLFKTICVMNRYLINFCMNRYLRQYV